MSAPVPSLSSSGWVTDPAEKADLLLSNYFNAEYSQTHLYQGEVVSLPKQIQENGHDPLILRSRIQDDLERYLTPYFDQVILNVTTDIPAPEEPNRINVTVDCVVIDKGERHSLGRLINTEGSRIVSIAHINNFVGGN